MARPLFSDMLLNRRRQLGLSIKQASNVLRLKEEVLIAFEEGDFDSIPKSGYAQGMLSSYARYLGLNAKTVVNQFSADLFEHERGSGSHEVRRRNRRTRDADDGPLYETPQAAAPRSQRTYVESHGFLPTSGGFAGDMGDFATTSAARPRYSSTQQSSGGDAYPQGRPYTSRVPVSQGSVTPLGQSQRQRPTASRRTASSIPGAYDTQGYSSTYGYRDDVTTRRVMPSQYRDDMRLDNDGRSYEAASSTSGRRSSRNIASTERPNVRRRRSSGSREQLRERDRARSMGSNGGIVGMVGEFLQDRTKVMILLVSLLCLLLTGTIIFSVRSCVGAQQGTGRSVTVTSQDNEQTEDETTSSKDEEMSSEEERARAEAAAAKAAETDSSATERTFEVTVADGEVTWIEIEYDGNSDVAETVTGPWNRTYTVRKSISINVNDTSAVTVTEGGKKLEFDSKASGIGTISIQVSKGGTDDATTTDGQATDQAQQQGDQGQQGDQAQQGTTPVAQDGTQAQTQQQMGTQEYQEQSYTQQDGSSSGGQSQFEGYTLDADGYYYGSDGYYDAAGNFYSY